jgi:hypothetical protein
MNRIERFGVLLVALVAIALVLRGMRSLRQGEAKGKYRTYLRHESPAGFWGVVVSDFVIALVVMPLVIRHFLTRP